MTDGIASSQVDAGLVANSGRGDLAVVSDDVDEVQQRGDWVAVDFHLHGPVLLPA